MFHFFQLRSNEVSPAGFGFEDNYLQHNTLINLPNFQMRNLRDLNNFDRVICIHFDDQKFSILIYIHSIDIFVWLDSISNEKLIQ